MKKKGRFSVILVIVAVNIAGLLLRYFNLDTYIILAGFRFQLSFVLPFLLFSRMLEGEYIKKLFTHPGRRRSVLPLAWILVPAAAVILVLFLLKKITPGDPEYFYEFGLSSVIDYPVYLVWNFPQVMLLFIFLKITSKKLDGNISSTVLTAALLFAYELVPLNSNFAGYPAVISVILFAVILVLFIEYYDNIYWFSILVFSIPWLYFLVFGSRSGEIINMLFAVRYTSWEGFLVCDKDLLPFVFVSQLLLTILIMTIFTGKRGGKAPPDFRRT